MAEVLRFVNTASTAGGDGTTNATTGANRAYASLNEWEAAEQTNLVTAGDTHRVVCEGTAADTTRTDVSGWTTGASNFITIETDPNAAAGRHNGKFSTSHYRIDTTATEALAIRDLFVRVFGLQLRTTGTSGWSATLDLPGFDPSDIRIGYCIVESQKQGNSGIFSRGDDIVVKIFNTVVGPINYLGSPSDIGIECSSTGTVDIFNCTIATATTGIDSESGNTVTVKNTTVADCTDDFNLLGTTTIDFCASDDGDGTNAQTLSGTRSDDFVDFVNTDFHTVAGSVMVNNGVTDPGSGLFLDDIEGQSRRVSWDIGMDELRRVLVVA